MLIILFMFSLYLFILWYILSKKDCELALRFTKFLIVIVSIKFLFVAYHFAKGKKFCEIGQKIFCF